MPRGAAARRAGGRRSGRGHYICVCSQHQSIRGWAGVRAAPRCSTWLPHILCCPRMRSAALPLRLMGLEVGLGEALQCSGRRDLMLVSGLSPAGICGPVLPRAPSVTCWDPSCVRQLHVGPHQAHQQLLRPPEQAVVVSSAAATLGLPREDAGASGVNHPEGDSHTFDGLLRSRPRRCCHRNATCSPELHRSPSRRPVGWWGRVGIHDSTTTGPRRPGSIAGRPLWVSGGLRLGPRHARSAQVAPILALLASRAKH